MKFKFLIFLIFIHSFTNANEVSILTTPYSDRFDEYSVSTEVGQEFLVNRNEIFELQSLSFPFQETLKTLTNLKPDTAAGTRGVKDAALFKATSPSVVLIFTKSSIGSGTLINDKGLILTNWHVVGDNPEVGVIFKPLSDTQKYSDADALVAKVIKLDQIADLALIQVTKLPMGRKPLKIGDVSEIGIGEDVHAIGHPKGESWTYTKGVISQYRNDYKWGEGKDGPEHIADVIQTQTPINPGNSGGPLISEGGNLIGVNSFGMPSAQGLNYAVSVDDVQKFLERKESRILKVPKKVTEKEKCEMKVIYEGKSKDNKSDITVLDSKCSGKADMEVIIPLDKSEPQLLRIDRNGDEKPDVLIFSYSRDYKWEFSLWDDNYDGKWDLVGYHENGEIKPYKFESYIEFQKRSSSKNNTKK